MFFPTLFFGFLMQCASDTLSSVCEAPGKIIKLCMFTVYSHFQALRCIGDLICGHPKNLDALGSRILGEGPQEPALNSILRIILRTSSTQEFVAADYVFKNFCEVDNAFHSSFCSTIHDFS